MVRIGLPVAAAAAIMTLTACSTLSGANATPDGTGASAGNALFPPPPPILSDEATAPDDAAAVDRVLAELRTTLTQLSTEIGQNRRRLAELQAEVESTRAQIERLLERGRPSPQAIPAAAPEPAETGPSRPLVRIRFDQPSIDYLDALHEAVQTALAQLPDAGFEVVAVASLEARESDAAERHAATVHAEEVMTTLLDMGVPPSQLTLSLATIREARGNEVRIYIR